MATRDEYTTHAYHVLYAYKGFELRDLARRRLGRCTIISYPLIYSQYMDLSEAVQLVASTARTTVVVHLTSMMYKMDGACALATTQAGNRRARYLCLTVTQVQEFRFSFSARLNRMEVSRKESSL